MIILFGALLSYSIYKNICIYGINNNNCPKTNINKIRKLHIHHWIIHLLILLVMFKKNINNEILIGLNIGGILHGVLEYDDWYIIYNPNEN